jgi:transcription initiation factor TFIIIB Brf1 subunit/transcription initiation factor TFIIB
MSRSVITPESTPNPGLVVLVVPEVSLVSEGEAVGEAVSCPVVVVVGSALCDTSVGVAVGAGVVVGGTVVASVCISTRANGEKPSVTATTWIASPVAENSRGTAEELKSAYDALNRELGLPVGPIDPAEYLPRYASQLDLSTRVERRAREFVAEAEERGLTSGRNPSGVAAACLYTAAKEVGSCAGVTQAEAASVADVTPVTLRGTYHDLRE